MPKWSIKRHIKEHNIKTSAAPALATFNGDLYMVLRERGSDNLSFSVFDGGSWGKETRIPNNFTAKAPALAEFNGQLYLSYRGKNSNHLCYCTMDKDQNWSNPIKLSDQNVDARSKSGPALATLDTKGEKQLLMAWNGTGGDTLWYSVYNGETWTPASQINAKPQFGPSLANYKGTLYIAYRKRNDKISCHRYDSEKDKWSLDQEVAVPGRNPRTSGGPALVADDRLLYLVFRDFRTNQERDPVPLWYAAFDGFNWRYLINLHSVNGAFTSQRVGLAYWEKKVFMVFGGDNKGNMWQCDYDPKKGGQVIAHRANVITKWA
ncbi:MAG: exo-alpha-sialidase, partial [bacterium]|nr:exo-alpha-sialidase [bacterium]